MKLKSIALLLLVSAPAFAQKVPQTIPDLLGTYVGTYTDGEACQVVISQRSDTQIVVDFASADGQVARAGVFPAPQVTRYLQSGLRGNVSQPTGNTATQLVIKTEGGAIDFSVNRGLMVMGLFVQYASRTCEKTQRQ